MACLASILYDPATSVSKSTAATLAMTPLDTINLRATFQVPANGRVLVRLQGVLHGAATIPQIFMGAMEGAVIRMRQAPMVGGGNLAATSLLSVESVGVVSGLTPTATLIWDAAYAVETLVAATGLKYGGLNNITANDAFGAFAFEIWNA